MAVTLSDGQVVHQRLVRSWPLIACQILCREQDDSGVADGATTKIRKTMTPEEKAEANAAANAKRAAEWKAAKELKAAAEAAKKKAEPNSLRKQKRPAAATRLAKAVKEALKDTAQSNLDPFIVVQDGKSSTPEPNADT